LYIKLQNSIFKLLSEIGIPTRNVKS